MRWNKINKLQVNKKIASKLKRNISNLVETRKLAHKKVEIWKWAKKETLQKAKGGTKIEIGDKLEEKGGKKKQGLANYNVEVIGQ